LNKPESYLKIFRTSYNSIDKLLASFAFPNELPKPVKSKEEIEEEKLLDEL
jgi:hypothetical protein